MRIPDRMFSRMRAEQWVNLALAALLLLYVIFAAGSVWSQGVFGYAGGDYRSFLATAEIALEVGFAQIYDLDIQESYQRPLYERYLPPASTYAYTTAPMYYLPPFVLPLLWLPLFHPLTGFGLWTVLNGALLVLYLYRFSRAIGGVQGHSLFKLLLIFPVFANLFFGQVSIWLLVFLGEFLLACRKGNPFQGGLWLGGLLLKPQLFFLLGPGLLLGRRFKMLAGLVLAGLVLLGLSLALVGAEGLLDLGRLFFLSSESSQGLATNNPQLMINWRALAVNLLPYIPEWPAWAIAVTGMAITALVTFWMWLRSTAWDIAAPPFALVLLGTYAASCTVAWHSHIHMALPLIVLLLYWQGQGQPFPQALLNTWVLAPPLLFFLGTLLRPGFGHDVVGLAMLILNVCLLGWAVGALYRRTRQNVPEETG